MVVNGQVKSESGKRTMGRQKGKEGKRNEGPRAELLRCPSHVMKLFH